MYILLACLVLVASFFVYRFQSRKAARANLLATPLSDEERAIVERQVPLVRKLPPELRQRLEGKMNLFLDQVSFIGNNDLDVTDEMRLSIAAQACLLVVNTEMWYENLKTILVYPNAFKSKRQSQNGFVVTEKQIVRSGESWHLGPVVLSWAHSQQGSLNDTDGHNVVLHEFAHQIDDMSGKTNGIPLLGKGQSFAEWERVFLKAFDEHVHNVERRRKTVIDPYGAEGHEEFFAVSVEVFFERPRALKKEDPEVYAQLSKLFRLDPENWS